jgi:excinuclease ABC subunit B
MPEQKFILYSDYQPQGDQPQAIASLVAGIQAGRKNQVLLGVTGSGKTFTMAKIIERVQMPTLILSHNKTLAAQLYAEFREFFPQNAVEYFVSFYDYYQPEAYIPQTDVYISKDSSINDEIDRLRHSATASLLSRKDVIIVASVSCIYGLGDPEDYEFMTLSLKPGEFRDRDQVIRRLVGMQYSRNEIGFTRGTFRVHGDMIDIIPINSETITRIEFFGDEIDRIYEIDPLTGEKIQPAITELKIYPASHHITSEEKVKYAIRTIREELALHLQYLRENELLVEAQRLEQRTFYDLEMLEETGYCSGIENYSRHLTGRLPNEAPATLLDYFPKRFLTFIDESHVSVPQVNGMYAGDRSRKETLIKFGFRLPSALDNRPLRFGEFERQLNQVVFVSATPGPYELNHSQKIVEQIIRPTGLADPVIFVRPLNGQIDDLMEEIGVRIKRRERVLVTTLTKKMAENLTEYLSGNGLRVQYLHCEVQTLERIEILRDLRLGKYDVLVGINLLREGLDLPEVSLVAIIDADKEGFLRSETALIQTIGRAARHVRGQVIMYADKISSAMERAIAETNRRRRIQLQYNEQNGVTPTSVRKAIRDLIHAEQAAESKVLKQYRTEANLTDEEIKKKISGLEKEMLKAASALLFERAKELRDELYSWQKKISDD